MKFGWGNIKAGAEYTGVSIRTFRKLLRLGLPYSKLPTGGIVVCFRDIDDYLRLHTVKADQVSQIAESIVADLK